MAQWGQAQPQYPMQTGFNPQFQQQGFSGQPQGFPAQRQGFLQPQATGYPAASGFLQQQQQPQQTGFQHQQPQQTGFSQQPQFQQPQQTGFAGSFVQQRPAPPPVPALPTQFQQQNVNQGAGFLGQPQQQPNRFPSSSPAVGGLAPQMTGFPAGGGLSSNFGGGVVARPLIPQATGFVDPRLTMMSNTFMPANPALPYTGGMPQFQQQSGPSLQQNFQQHNQTQRGTTTVKVPWALSKAEKKNYDQIFRAWDASGSGFISGQTALEVFGQSGLDKNELARVWALADADNRGKLNLAEFHVAMGLIYRRLSGNDLPEELPQEMVPPSARDLNSSVDIVKEILKNDTRSASYNSPVSKMRERSFNSSGALGAGGRQDATVYKHDEMTEPLGGVYQPRSRHVDRSTVRVNNDDPVEDLSAMKRQLENTARLLDRNTEENSLRTREDEELEREMEDLRYRIKRLQDDLDYVSRGPRSVSKDEERRKLERELLHLMHEKLPALEKRIEDNQTRKDREKREQTRDRDRRNERFGRFDDRDDDRDRYRYEDGRYSRNGYDRDRSRERAREDRSRDFNSRDYDRYDKRDDRERDFSSRDDRDRTYDRRRSTPAAPSPPPPTVAPIATTNSSSPAPAASSNAKPSKMSREEYKAFVQVEAQRKLQERLRALGLHTTSTPTPEFSDVSDRLANEKKEAEEKARTAERDAEERIRLREERLANEKALKEGTKSPSPPAKVAVSAPIPTPPKAPPALKSRAPAPPPPRKPPAPRPSVVSRSPAKSPAPTVPKIHQAPALRQEPQVDPEEVMILAREAELQRKREAREAREARLRELEKEEEEESRLAKEAFEKRQQAFARKSAASVPSEVSPSPPAPPPPVTVSAPISPQLRQEIVASPAPVPTVPSAAVAGDKPSTNPFSRFLGDGSATPQSSASSVVSPANGSTNPFFRGKPEPAAADTTPPPPKSPAPVPVKTIYHTVPSESDDEWNEVIEKDDDGSSEDEFTGSRDKRKNLAEKFFGNILPPARPQSGGPSAPVSPPPLPPPDPMSYTPLALQPADVTYTPSPPPPPSAPPVSNPLAALGGRSALLSSIQGGARLKKAPVNDRSGSALSGRVLGDTAPPPHINAARRSASPPIAPPALETDNRQSVDWYVGLAAEHGVHGHRESSLPVTIEESKEVGTTNVSVPNIEVVDVPNSTEDPLADIDRSVEYRVRSLYSYEGQRPEDLSFNENVILTAHPSKSGADWWYGTLVSNSRSGFFPQTYVDRIKSITTKALYSYDGSNPDELTFAEGDALSVIDQSDGDWWKVEQNGLVFIVPAAYLEVVEDAQPDAQDLPTVVTYDEETTSQTEPVDAHSLASETEDIDSECSSSSFESEDEAAEISDEQLKREQEAREDERQRLLEAAGLVVAKDRRRPPPRRPYRLSGPRPPPTPPDRSAMSGDIFVKELPAVPPDPDESENAVGLDDAYERYEAFKLNHQSASANRLSVASIDTISSAAPMSLVHSPILSSSKMTSDISENRSYSSFLNFLGRSRTPGSDGDKKPTIIISAPIPITREPSPAVENAPDFGTSWASLVDKSALDGIPQKERRRQEAIFELINTENTYVRDLQLVVEVFYSSILPLLELKATTVIFANIEDILLTNTAFLSSLEERQKESRLYVNTIGDILRDHMNNMSIYTQYCVNESTAEKLLQSMRNSNAELNAHLQRLRDQPSVRNLDLSHYLLAPMQRITRYPLLIKQILQYTEVAQDRKDIEQSLLAAENILKYINESIRYMEGRERLRIISQDLWIGQGRLDLTAPTRNMGPRRLLKEGLVSKSKSGRKLRAFLCSDIFFLTDENAKALYRMPIPVVYIQVKESSGTRDDTLFHLKLSHPRGGETISLRATSVRECQLWMQGIEFARRRCRRADEYAMRNKSRTVVY